MADFHWNRMMSATESERLARMQLRLPEFLRKRGALLIWIFALALCFSWNYNQTLEHSKSRDQRYFYGWDENHYYAWARSWLHDGDADFRNDFEYVVRMRGMGYTSEVFANSFANDCAGPERIPNKYGIGMAMLTFPAMLAGKAVVSVHEKTSGERVSPFASIYLMLFLWSAIVVGFCGLAAGYWLLVDRVGPWFSALAIAAGFLGLPLLFYLWFNAGMAHAAGFGVGTAFVASAENLRRMAVARLQDDRPLWPIAGASVLTGLLLGLSLAIRYPNFVFGIVLPPLGFAAWHGAGKPLNARAALLLLVAAHGIAFGLAMAFFPQMLAWKTLYGKWIVYSYEGEVMNRFPVHALKVLAGTRNSLLLWSPVSFIGIAGLIAGAWRRDALCIAGLFVLSAFLWIYGSWEAYWLGASFGMRGLVDASFFFMLGLAEWTRIIYGASPKAGSGVRRGFGALVIGCVAWNVWMLGATRSGLQPMEAPFQGKRILREAPRVIEQIEDDLDLLVESKGRRYPLMTPFGSVVEGQ
jgi:hypothetical protein